MKSDIRQNPPKIMSVKEAAIYIGVSERLLRDRLNAGYIRHSRLGARILIRLEDINKFMDEFSR